MKSQCLFSFPTKKALELIHHGLQTGSLAGIEVVFMDMSTTLRRPPYSIGICEDSVEEDPVDEAGVNGIVYEPELDVVLTGEQLGAGDDDSATLTDNGDRRSMSFSRWPRWVISFVPSLMSTPGVDAKHLDTSVAQWVKPARNLSASVTGLAARRCWRRSLCRCCTVSSRMSAFSSLLTFSPSA